MNILKMENITKSFFGVKVLKNVAFSAKRGEVHALLGENGAGKSTLMNILSGVYELEEGNVFFEDSQLTNMTTKKAIDVGIAFVHQELNLFNDLKVYENIYLGSEILTKFKTVDNKKMIEETEKLFESLGVKLDPRAVVEDLKVSEKQLLEIVKALRVNAKLIILDEPTTALSNEEIDYLFESINILKKQGTAFIFISHKMPEIFRICDSFTVLRNGELVSTGKISDVSPEEVTKMMIGARYSDVDVYEKRVLGEEILSLTNVSNKNLNNISFTLKEGEIFSVTGLHGSGASELLQTIFGTLPIESGIIAIKDKEKPRFGIKKSMKLKVAMLAANRKENSVIHDMSILENLYISEHTLSMKEFKIKNKKERDNYDNYKDSLNIVARSCNSKITNLSGGNQQKVIISRWLNTDADILLFDNPTQGIDVGAKNEIYKLIIDLSKQGKTIIVNTLEMPEIEKISDRCLVMYQGNAQIILDRENISEENVMLYATHSLAASEGEVDGK